MINLRGRYRVWRYKRALHKAYRFMGTHIPVASDEHCGPCYRAREDDNTDYVVRATHKVGEQPPTIDPTAAFRHEFTQYVCCRHFRELMGSAVLCPVDEPTSAPQR